MNLLKLLVWKKKALYNYFQILRDYRLIFEYYNNLILLSTAKLKKQHRERKKYQITITKKETLETIEARLCAKIIESHFRKIEFWKAFKKFENSHYKNRDTFKKGSDENEFVVISLSNRNMQKLLNVGQRKAAKIIDILNELGVIQTTKRKARPVIDNIPRHAGRFYGDDRAGHVFVENNTLFIQFGNYQKCLEYPVKKKVISYPQYIKFRRSVKCKKDYNKKKVI